MNLNLYLHELKQYRFSFVIWCLSICGLILIGMAFYPMLVQENFSEVLMFVFEYPLLKNLMAAFNVDLLGLTNIASFYVVYTSLYVTLTGCIFSATLGVKILAKEEHEKTADFLFTRPLSRISVFLSKFAALLSLLIILNLAVTLSGILGMELFKNENSLLLNLTPAAKEQFSSALRSSPRQFRERFELTDQDYLSFSLEPMLEELQQNPGAGREYGFDPEAAAGLLKEALVSPQNFLARVQADPEEYCKLLNIPESEAGVFIQGLSEAQSRIDTFQLRLEKEPELYVELFDADPGRFLEPFKTQPLQLQIFLDDFGLPPGVADHLFVYYYLDNFLLLCFYVFLLMFWMAGLGLMLSQLSSKSGSLNGAVVGIILAGYFFNSLSNALPRAGALGYLSPFKFVDSDILNPAYGMQWWRVLYFAGFSLLFLTAALLVFRKKDILV